MDSFAGILEIGLAVAAIASLAALGLFRGTLTNLKENLSEARAEIADKDRRLTECQTENATLKADNAALTRVVTGEVHWVSLGQQLDNHHRAAEDHWRVADTKQDETNDLLSDIRDNLRET